MPIVNLAQWANVAANRQPNLPGVVPNTFAYPIFIGTISYLACTARSSSFPLRSHSGVERIETTDGDFDMSR